MVEHLVVHTHAPQHYRNASLLSTYSVVTAQEIAPSPTLLATLELRVKEATANSTALE